MWKGLFNMGIYRLIQTNIYFTVCISMYHCETQRTRMHVTDTTATPNGHQMIVVTWDRSIPFGWCLLWNRTGSIVFFNTFFFLFTHIDMEPLLRWQKCTERYLFYWYAKFCSNTLVTDDTGNAPSLKSAWISSNSFFAYFNFWWEMAQLSGFNSKVIVDIRTILSLS